MRCTSCDAENKADALFCRKCGTAIKKCAHCGVLSESDALFCRRCGERLGIPSAAAATVAEDDASEATLPRRAAPNAEPKVDFRTSRPKPVKPLSQPGAQRRALKVACAAAVLVFAVVAAVLLLGRHATQESARQQPPTQEQVRTPDAAGPVQTPNVPEAAPKDSHAAPAVEPEAQPEDAAQAAESLIVKENRKLDEVKSARRKEEARLKRVQKEIARSGRNVEELRKEEAALKSSIKAHQKEEAALTSTIEDLRGQVAALKKRINGLRREEAALKGSVNRRKAQQEANVKNRNRAKTPAKGILVAGKRSGRQGRRGAQIGE